MIKSRILSLALLVFVTTLPLSAYTVFLKDGAQLIAKEPPEIRGNMAIITLQNGTQSSLPASEIDLERTRQANQNDIGSALILEGGEFTSQPNAPEPKREERLSDLTNRSLTRAPSRRSTKTPGSARSPSPESRDLLTWERSPFRNLDIASELQGVFRGQGVEQTRLYQGTSSDRILIDLTTDSEAAVFRGLKVAATALGHLQTSFPGAISAFELVLTTSDRSRAGQFLLDASSAERLVNGAIEPSAFYVENVQF
jgi:hypothetical protein